MTSQITSLTIVYSTVCSGADQSSDLSEGKSAVAGELNRTKGQ